MQLNALAVFVRGGECWHADIVDISATGILAQIPDGAFWKVDQQFRIEMIALDVGTISVEARLVRIDDDCAGFAFTAIPAGSQVPLWSLLGAFADRRDGAEATPRN